MESNKDIFFGIVSSFSVSFLPLALAFTPSNSCCHKAGMTIFAVQKTGMENDLFLVRNRVTAGQPGGTLLPEIPGNTYLAGKGGIQTVRRQTIKRVECVSIIISISSPT